MKQLLLTLVAFLVTVAVYAGNDSNAARQHLIDAFAAKLPNTSDKQQRIEAYVRFINSGLQNSNKTEGLAQRITGYRYDEVIGGNWSLYDSVTLAYSGNLGSSYLFNNLFDVKVDYGWDSANVVNQYRYTYTRDGNGWATGYLTEKWNVGAFENYRRNQYTYNTAGKVLTNTIQSLNAGSWENTERFVYTYDANNNCLTQVYQQWIVGAWKDKNRYTYAYSGNKIVHKVYETDNGSGLENLTHTDYTFDANGDNTEILLQNWVSGTWENSRLNQIVYDANHAYTLYTEQVWVGGAWEDEHRFMFTYNADGYVLEKTGYNWNGSTWAEEDRYLYAYDANNHNTEFTYQSWLAGAWSNGYRYLFTYDASGNPDIDIYQVWVTGAWENSTRTNYDYNAYGNLDYRLAEQADGNVWEIANQQFYYYELYNAPSAIAEVKSVFAFKAYPNPASNILNIDYTSQNNSETVVRIYDLTGREVMSVKHAADIGDNYLKLDVSSLSAGMYVFEATQGTQQSRSRFSKQ
ncbi:MAG: T9SS type A sorting domain-containing protein [Chitinophagales bacterium]